MQYSKEYIELFRVTKEEHTYHKLKWSVFDFISNLTKRGITMERFMHVNKADAVRRWYESHYHAYRLCKSLQ